MNTAITDKHLKDKNSDFRPHGIKLSVIPDLTSGGKRQKGDSDPVNVREQVRSYGSRYPLKFILE